MTHSSDRTRVHSWHTTSGLGELRHDQIVPKRERLMWLLPAVDIHAEPLIRVAFSLAACESNHVADLVLLVDHPFSCETTSLPTALGGDGDIATPLPVRPKPSADCVLVSVDDWMLWAPQSRIQSAYVCAQCNKAVKTRLQCARCAGVTYCSKNCQRAHWTEHKQGCRTVVPGQGFYTVALWPPQSMTEFAERVTLKRTMNCYLDRPMPRDDDEAVYRYLLEMGELNSGTVVIDGLQRVDDTKFTTKTAEAHNAVIRARNVRRYRLPSAWPPAHPWHYGVSLELYVESMKKVER